MFIFCSFSSYAQYWDSVGTDLHGLSAIFKEFDGQLYVGGVDSVNGVNLGNIGVWDGVKWDTLAHQNLGIDGSVMAIEKFNGEIFIGGSFTDAGPPSADIKHLTRWDGVQFNDMGFSFQGNRIRALQTYNGELYIGGTFNIFPGSNYPQIAKFDGQTLSMVGSGFQGWNREVYCMTIYNNELIVGGRFEYADGKFCQNIAMWNGTTWDSLGLGCNYYVRDLVVDSINNVLYAAGTFSHAGGISAPYVAKWDGTTWHDIGSPLVGTSEALVIYNSILYVGTDGSSNEPSSIYKYDGTTWTPMSPAPNHQVSHMYVYKGEMYVGGNMTEVNGVPYAGFLRYNDGTTGIEQLSDGTSSLLLYPNPSNSEIIISHNLDNSVEAYLSIMNILGEVVIEKHLSVVSDKIRVEISNLPLGTYSCRITQGANSFSSLFIKN